MHYYKNSEDQKWRHQSYLVYTMRTADSYSTCGSNSQHDGTNHDIDKDKDISFDHTRPARSF